MNSLSVPVGPADHSLGPAGAPVTLVQYGSYDCPHCAQAQVVIRQILSGQSGQVRFVYRHFPRETPHSESLRAAEAAEAAGEQGKFWEMHAHLLSNQQSLRDADLLAAAAMHGLNVARLASDLDAHVHEAAVRRQFQSGLDSGVMSTPTFFINGVRHDGGWDLESLTEAIQAAGGAPAA